MTRPERLLLLAWFAAVLFVLGGGEQTATAVGGVAGTGAGVLVAGRARRLSARIDAKLGPDDARPPTGATLRRPAVRAAAHAAVLGALLLTTLFVPFVGEELFAAAAAAVTALALVLTAARLRR